MLNAKMVHKRCMNMELEGTLWRGRPRKTLWHSVKGDVEIFDLSHEDVKYMDH